MVSASINVESHVIIPPLPFSHLADNSNIYAPLAGPDAYYRRNSQLLDMYSAHASQNPEVRSRAGSTFDIGDFYSKEPAIEDNVYTGSISSRLLYSNSLFKR
jgi:hypothetical protein